MGSHDFMEDCIHLHACRSLHKRFINAGMVGAKYVARHCDINCRCYQYYEAVEVLTPDEAAGTAQGLYDGPSEPGDVFCPWDFPAETVMVVRNGPHCTTDD